MIFQVLLLLPIEGFVLSDDERMKGLLAVYQMWFMLCMVSKYHIRPNQCCHPYTGPLFILNNHMHV